VFKAAVSIIAVIIGGLLLLASLGILVISGFGQAFAMFLVSAGFLVPAGWWFICEYKDMQRAKEQQLGFFGQSAAPAQRQWKLVAAGAVVAAIGGSIIGMLAGYAGGIIDTLIVSIIDFFIGIPDLLLMVVLGVFLGPGLANIIFAISLVSWIMPAKIVRSEVLKIKTENYIRLSKAYGAHFWHIFAWHLWKPLFSIILVSVIKIMNKAILAEASLAYLGLGDPLSKSWGMTITRAMDFPTIYLTDFWKWWLVFPTTVMVCTVLSVAAIGRWMELRIGGRTRS